MRFINTIKKYIPLHITFFVFSLCGILSKFAARFELMSPPFWGIYAAFLLIMAVYSFAWQLMLRRYSLTTAYANRGALTIWGIIWSVALFGERLTPGKTAAVVLVVSGVVLVGVSND